MDRYIALGIGPAFGATLAVVVSLLTLENLPRLMARMVDVAGPLRLLGSYIVALMPEYVAIGLLVALYLSIALAFRKFALRGELDVMSGSGLSNLALLKTPLFVALAVAMLLCAVRGYGEPWGEQRLDSLGAQIRNGDHGLRIQAGQVLHLARGNMISVDRIAPEPNSFEGVFVRQGDTILTAARATARFGSDRKLQLLLEQGRFVRSDHGVPVAAGRFDILRIALPLDAPPSRPLSARERFDRMTVATLVAIMTNPAPPSPMTAAATAALSARLATACFCLVLPFAAFALGIPPKRSRSAIGLGVGILLIVLFIRMNASIEDGYPALAVPLHAALLAGWAAAVWLMMRITLVGGAGAIEALLARAFAPPLAALRRPLR